MDSNHRYPGHGELCCRARRSFLRRAGGGEVGTAVHPDFFCSASHSIEPGCVHSFGGLRFATLLGRFCFPAVQLKYTFALHRLDQQFAERPYQGINAAGEYPAAARSISDVKFVIWSSSRGKVPM